MTPPTPASTRLSSMTMGARRSGCEARLRLLPSGDGWSLVAPDGRLVFHALGISGRRRCLEAATARGVLTVV